MRITVVFDLTMSPVNNPQLYIKMPITKYFIPNYFVYKQQLPQRK